MPKDLIIQSGFWAILMLRVRVRGLGRPVWSHVGKLPWGFRKPGLCGMGS